MSEALKTKLDTLQTQKSNESNQLKTSEASVKHLDVLIKELEKFVKEIEKIETAYKAKHYDLVNMQDGLVEFKDKVHQQVNDDANLNDEARQDVIAKVKQVDDEITAKRSSVDALAASKGTLEQGVADAELAVQNAQQDLDNWRRPDKFIGDKQQAAADIRDKVREARDEGKWKAVFYYHLQFVDALSDIGTIPVPDDLCKVLEERWDRVKSTKDSLKTATTQFENNKDDLATVQLAYEQAVASREEDIISLIS